MTRDEAEQIRKKAFQRPDRAIAAAAKQEHRFTNFRMNAAEIARHGELITVLDENNAAPAAFGEPAIEIETVDPADLEWRALNARLAELGRLIWQQTDRLDHLRASAAQAERDRAIAAETRAERLLRERAEATESRLAELEARHAEAQRPQRYVPPPPADADYVECGGLNG